MFEQLSMSALGDGQSAYVTRVDGDPAMRRRLLDLGLIPGTRVSVRGTARQGTRQPI